jgi:PadR family transcriptional regulator PadR
MKLLSRSEEVVLLTVWKLQEEAYCVPIREYLMNVTKKNWSFGSTYAPLERLEKRGFLESYTTDPIKERGGRSKRIYKVTKKGKKALMEIRSIQDMLWEAVPELKI